MVQAEQADIGLEESQLRLHAEVADILGVSLTDIAEWHINRIREDGCIDAHIPLEQIDVAGVPTDPRNTAWLKGLIDKRAEEVGGSGQRDAVVIGHVPGDSLYMLDGFHRHEAQTLRNEYSLHSTIEPNLTYETVVTRRIEYAHEHPEIEFARQVEWMQSVWERSPLSEIVPNVLTAFRAFQSDYARHRTDDVELLDSLSDDVFNQVRAWVRNQSREWGYSPAEIRKNLATVESFDTELMRLVYQKQGPAPPGRISLKHVELITATFGGEFDLQKAVVEIIVGQGLGVRQTEALIRLLEDANPRYPKDITRAASKIDFLTLKAVSRPAAARNVGSTAVRREQLANSNASEALRYVRRLLPELQAQAFRGKWSKEDTENALEISMVLSETLAQLAKSSRSEE